MSLRYTAIWCVLLLTLGLFISSCEEKKSSKDEPANKGGGSSASTTIATQPDDGTIVYTTDTTEWKVKILKEHLLYSEAVSITLPAPWRLPTKEEAQFLRTLTFSDSKERFITSDGYTFLMPSASVTKAGEKTKYSILGLYIRRSAIYVEF